MKKYFAILSVSIFLAIPIFSFQAKACDSINLSTGDCLMDMGGGDLMNLNTGEMLWDLDGDKLGSDGIYFDMGDGDLLSPKGELQIILQ